MNGGRKNLFAIDSSKNSSRRQLYLPLVPVYDSIFLDFLCTILAQWVTFEWSEFCDFFIWSQYAESVKKCVPFQAYIFPKRRKPKS